MHPSAGGRWTGDTLERGEVGRDPPLCRYAEEASARQQLILIYTPAWLCILGFAEKMTSLSNTDGSETWPLKQNHKESFQSLEKRVWCLVSTELGTDSFHMWESA